LKWYLFVDELDLVEDEHEGDPRGLGLDDEPGERGGLRPGLVEREEHDEAVDVGDGRVGDLGPPLEDVLDHAAAVGPVDGAHKDAVPDEDAAADLLEQRADDAEQVGAAMALQARGRGVHDDAHEVGLRRRDEPRGLRRGQLLGGRGREGRRQREQARVRGGVVGRAAEGREGVGAVAGWERERLEREAQAEAGQRRCRRRGGGEERHFGVPEKGERTAERSTVDRHWCGGAPRG